MPLLFEPRFLWFDFKASQVIKFFIFAPLRLGVRIIFTPRRKDAKAQAEACGYQ
jgi:hypothetical protein